MGISTNNFEKFHEEIPSIKDINEAEEYIREMFEKGERPVVTVPLEYAEALRNGLKSHTTWVPGFNMTAGTIGREPYKSEGRIKVILKEIPVDRVRPRFTGPDNSFHGVVCIEGPIDSEMMEII